MYEFKPKKTDRIAPLWFIMVALISLLIGVNVTLYFFPIDKSSTVTAGVTATQTIKVITPSATQTSSATSTITQTASPTPTNTI